MKRKAAASSRRDPRASARLFRQSSSRRRLSQIYRAPCARQCNGRFFTLWLLGRDLAGAVSLESERPYPDLVDGMRPSGAVSGVFLISYGLLRLESDARGASVMGLVGAGGIGQGLVVAIRRFPLRSENEYWFNA